MAAWGVGVLGFGITVSVASNDPLYGWVGAVVVGLGVFFGFIARR